jgi:hypothetical protein
VIQGDTGGGGGWVWDKGTQGEGGGRRRESWGEEGVQTQNLGTGKMGLGSGWQTR